jgi:hypothetical protein
VSTLPSTYPQQATDTEQTRVVVAAALDTVLTSLLSDVGLL